MGSGTERAVDQAVDQVVEHADDQVVEHADDQVVERASDPASGRNGGRDQVERVEGLLASVQDLVASLQRVGTELEHEVARALYRNGPASGSAQATLELENTRLKHAIEGRALIEQAKGMIIAGQGGTEQEAFGVLSQIARREDQSLREAAAGVIERGARAARARNAQLARELLLQGPVPPSGPAAPEGRAAGAPVQLAGASPDPESSSETAQHPSAATDSVANPVESADPGGSSGPVTMIEKLTIESSQDPVRRRWRPATPSHASGRRNAPRFRSSSN